MTVVATLSARLGWKPTAITVGALALWLLLAFANRGVTYHFAPLIVAAAAPVAARLDTDARLPRGDAVALGAASTAAATAGMLLLWALGALDGPVVVGGSAPAETGLAIAAGAVTGFVIGRFPGEARAASSRTRAGLAEQPAKARNNRPWRGCQWLTSRCAGSWPTCRRRSSTPRRSRRHLH